MSRPRFASVFHLVVIALTGLAVFVGGTFLIGMEARERLLKHSAEAEAVAWSRHLIAAIDELPAIISGATPSTQASAYLARSKAVGAIFRYKFFGPKGELRYVSDDARWSNFHQIGSGDISPEALSVMTTGKPSIASRRGDGMDRPRLFATAYVPLMVAGVPIGVIETYIDHTGQARQIDTIFVASAGLIALLTATAFLCPMLFATWQTQMRRNVASRLQHAARHDSLTGLLNRAAFMQALERLVRSRARFAVHFIDLDRFKTVNDTQGHPTGDAVLKKVAARLEEVVGTEAEVSRLGGDEFALVQVLSDSSTARAELVARRVVESLSQPYLIQEMEIRIGASIGISFFPGDAQTIERLLVAADLALYAAKHGGRGRIEVFTPEIEDAHRRRQCIETRLRDALEKGGFTLNYHPLYASDGIKLRAFEALLRLNDEDGEPIPPAVFIPIAEELHLIDRIGAWVLDEACRTAARWPEDIIVAVNLSPLQFHSGQLVEIVQAALTQSGLPAGRLELEVTESVLLENVESVLEQLKAFKQLGISIALDDFGTGYSSLSYLWRFPFDTLKVDATFMRGLFDPDSRSREVLDTIIALGRVLDLHVTAEGVETLEQMQLLRQMECDFLQGYLFGKPIAESDVAATILRSTLLRMQQKEAADAQVPQIELRHSA